MLTQLGEVKLRSDERMTIARLAPPDVEWTDKLIAFYSHKPPQWVRDITRRLRGEFNETCAEYFHFGTVGDEIVGGVWIGTRSGVNEVGMLGHVFTPEKHRQKGISNFLMRNAMEQFEKRGGRALYLDTGNPVARRIYENFGFRPYNPPQPEQAMIFRWLAEGENDFEKQLFAYDVKTRVREVSWGDWTWFDALYNIPTHPWLVRDETHGVYRNTAYEPQFLTLMDEVAEKRSVCLVLENSLQRVTAVARLVRSVRPQTEHVGTLEFFAHPSYFERLSMLIKETLDHCSALGIRIVRSYAASGDNERMEVLRSLHLTEIGRLHQQFAVGNERQDLVIFSSRE